MKMTTKMAHNPLIKEIQNDTGLIEPGMASASLTETDIPAEASPMETVISDGETSAVISINAAVSITRRIMTPAQTAAVTYRLLERNSL